MSDFVSLINTEESQKEVFDYKKYIVNPNKINTDVDNFITGKIKQGYKTGIEALDRHFVCKKNEFYALTGKKGRGKTTINQAIQIMQSIVNNLIWVVCFKENSNWSMKLNYMNYLLCDFAKDVKKTNPKLYQKASDWIDKHFIFIDVTDIKTALMVTEGIINNGTDVHALLIDPVNSFQNGWQNTGNKYVDGEFAALKILEFREKYCSVHMSQHPTISGQRQNQRVTSYDAELGVYLNKADFTWVIHREPGSSRNEIIVENVRNKHTGGGETENENPVILEWSPTSINIGYQDGALTQNNAIQYLLKKHNPLQLEEVFFKDDVLPKIDLKDAFDDVPF